MRKTSSFRVVDGLTMIAVCAIGLAWARDSWEAVHTHEGAFSGFSYQYSEISRRSSWRPPTLGETSLYDSTRALVASVIYVATPVASTWAVVLVVIDRLRRPRSRIWRARRPGAVACLAVTAVLILTFLSHVIRPSTRFNVIAVGAFRVRAEARYLTAACGEYWIDDAKFGPDPLVNAVFLMPRFAGFVIAGAWTALALAGAWKPEPTWVDRAGRLVGVFWLLAAVHFLVFPL